MKIYTRAINEDHLIKLNSLLLEFDSTDNAVTRSVLKDCIVQVARYVVDEGKDVKPRNGGAE